MRTKLFILLFLFCAYNTQAQGEKCRIYEIKIDYPYDTLSKEWLKENWIQSSRGKESKRSSMRSCLIDELDEVDLSSDTIIFFENESSKSYYYTCFALSSNNAGTYRFFRQIYNREVPYRCEMEEEIKERKSLALDYGVILYAFSHNQMKELINDLVEKETVITPSFTTLVTVIQKGEDSYTITHYSLLNYSLSTYPCNPDEYKHYEDDESGHNYEAMREQCEKENKWQERAKTYLQ